MEENKRSLRSTVIGGIIFTVLVLGIVVTAIISSQSQTAEETIPPVTQEATATISTEASAPTEPTMSEEERNQLIRESIDNAVADWISGTLTFDEAAAILNEIQSASDAELSEYASTQLAYITLENNGNLALALALEQLEAEEYPEVFEALNSIDAAYSRYEEASALYVACTDSVLDAVSNPNSKEEFETYIQLLDICYAQFKAKEFLNRKEELEEELVVFLDVTETIDLATARFDAKEIEEAFILLALGLEKYPDNERLATTLVDYRDHYIITVTKRAIELCEKEEYKEALSIVETAIGEYDCEEFQMLLEAIKEEKSFLYRLKNDVVDAFTSLSSGWKEEEFDVKQTANDAGAYIVKSGEKLALGDYSEEDITLLSFSGNVAASLMGADLLFDLRDLSYDVTHWGEEEYFTVWLAADVVALLPVIGVVKYISHFKTAANSIEAGSELVDSVADISKNAENTAELVDTIKDVAKTGDNIIEAVDNAKDAARAGEAAKDVVADVVKGYTLIETVNQKLLGKAHEITGIKFKLSEIELSDGRKLKGVFPVFESYADIQLPKDLYKASFPKQQQNCLEQLQKQLKNPFSKLRKNFTAEQLEDIANGILPDGFTWHHNEKEGLMQLVDTLTHDKTGHTGGMNIWGIGY